MMNMRIELGSPLDQPKFIEWVVLSREAIH